MQKHIQPLPSIIVQRFNFHSRSQHSGENVSTYVAKLRKLSEHCNFGDTLNDMLRDRLVCGINNQQVQRRLLSEPDLTFAKALELAQAAEAAERNARELESTVPSAAVNAVLPGQKGGRVRRSKTRRSRPTRCYRCDGNHLADKCRYKDSECHHCGKTGHLEKACRSKKRGLPPQSRTKTSQNTHHVDTDTPDDTPYEEQMFNIPAQQASPPLMVMLEVNQASLEIEIDVRIYHQQPDVYSTMAGRRELPAIEFIDSETPYIYRRTVSFTG